MSEPTISNPLTSCAVASLASPLVLRVPAWLKKILGGSGPNSTESSASYPPPLLSAKTCSGCARPDCVTCFATLPLVGTMLNGRICQHSKSGHHISDGVSSLLLPTPSASSYGSNRGGSAGRSNQPERPSLETLLKRCVLPTPLASDAKRGGSLGEARTGTLIREFTLPTPTVCGDWNRAGSSQRSGDGLSTVAGVSVALREWMMAFPATWSGVEKH